MPKMFFPDRECKSPNINECTCTDCTLRVLINHLLEKLEIEKSISKDVNEKYWAVIRAVEKSYQANNRGNMLEAGRILFDVLKDWPARIPTDLR